MMLIGVLGQPGLQEKNPSQKRRVKEAEERDRGDVEMWTPDFSLATMDRFLLSPRHAR